MKIDEPFDPKKMRFQFMLYRNGAWTLPDEYILAQLDRAEGDGVLDCIFYGDSKYSKQDFIDKLKYQAKNNLFLVVIYDGKPAGFGLLDNMRWRHAGFHFCIFSEYWGTRLAVDGSKEIYRRLLERFSVLVGVVPADNTFAIEFCRKLDLEELCVVPKYFYNDRLDMFVDGIQFVAAREG